MHFKRQLNIINIKIKKKVKDKINFVKNKIKEINNKGIPSSIIKV